MFTFLENLRKKPEPERKKAVLMITISCMFVIVAIWAILLVVRIEHTDFTFASEPENGSIPSLSDTFSNFKNALGHLMGGDSATSSAE